MVPNKEERKLRSGRWDTDQGGDFNYSPVKDELVSLVLAFAKRRKIVLLPNSDQTPNVSAPLSGPADTLILPMQDVVNINIRYVTYNEIEVPEPVQPNMLQQQYRLQK